MQTISCKNDKELKLLLLLTGWEIKQIGSRPRFIKNKYTILLPYKQYDWYTYSNRMRLFRHKTIPQLLAKLKEEGLI